MTARDMLGARLPNLRLAMFTAALGVSVGCATMTEDGRSSERVTPRDASVEAQTPAQSDSSVETTPPGPLDVSDDARAPRPLSSRCDAGVICSVDGGALSLRASDASCAELPVGCEAGSDYRGALWSEIFLRCMNEAQISCTLSGTSFRVDEAGCTTSFQDAGGLSGGDRAFRDCIIHFTSSFRWLCIASGSGYYYQSCTH